MSAALRSRLASTAWRWAWFAFVVLVVLSPLRGHLTLEARPSAPISAGYTDFVLFWSEIAALAVTVTWCVSLGLERRRIDLGPPFLRWPVAGLLAVAWLGVPGAVDPALAAYNALHVTALAALGLYVVNEVAGYRRLAVPAAIVLVTQAAVGIAQVIGGRSVGLSALGEQTLTPSMPVSVVTATDGTRLLRAYGLTDHPNILGGLLAVATLVVAGSVVARTAHLTWWRAAAAAAGAAGLFLTFSRGAWLGLAAGVTVLGAMLLLAHQRQGLRRLAAAGACGVLVTVPFVVPYQTALAARTDQSAGNATEQRSVDERVALAGSTARIIVEHPLLGTGVGALPVAMRAADPAFRYGYQPAHVVALVVAAETGIVGGALYVVILVAPWIALWRMRRRWTTELAVASAALAALTVVGLFDYYTWTLAPGRIWTGLIMGLWVVAYRQATTAERNVR